MLWSQWYRGRVGLFVVTYVTLQGANSIHAFNSSIVSNIFNRSSCSLDCENSGECQYINETVQELQNRVQSGLMIMKCQCPETYTGMGCEQVRPVCNLQTMKCPNNSPCEESSSTGNSNNATTAFHCDCSVADRISQTTARLCRNTYTEYCSPVLEIASQQQLLSFCTNGGKCQADVISAQLAPFNTSVNAQYEHAGCICPSEYYGPHCEFMIQQQPKPPTMNTEDTNSSTMVPTMDETSTSSETLEPTRDDDGDMEGEGDTGEDDTGEGDTGDGESIEDMINEYNTQTKATTATGTSSGSNDGRQILRVVLSSVVVAVTILALAVMSISYRQRRLKKCRHIDLQATSVPKDNKNSNIPPMYKSPSMTGSGSSSVASAASSVSSRNPTIKTGTRHRNTDEPLPTAFFPLRRMNTRTKRNRAFNHLTNIPESDDTLLTVQDDCDIVTVSNEQSFHRRCYPLTPFVVDDDDDDEVDVDTELQSSSGGLWNDSNNNSNSVQHHIQPIPTNNSMTMLMTNTTKSSAAAATPRKQKQQQQQQSTDHIQSWIVSLSNRAVNFTEILRQPGYGNHPTMIIEPVLDQVHNACNDIYLVDDDQDDDTDDCVQHNNNNYSYDVDNNNRFLDKYDDHL